MSWPAVELQEFCRTGSGTTPSRKKPELYEGNIPWVKSGELRENEILGTEEHVSEEALKSTSLKMVPAGALLVAMYGATVGRVGLLGIEATTNQAVCHVVPDPEKADRRYMFHLLQARAAELVSKGVGGAQPNISQGTIKQLKIPLPPLEEQRRIAGILDQADALRRLRIRAIDKLNTLGQAIFHEMFGDPFDKARSNQTVALEELTSRITYGFTSPMSHHETGIPIVTAKNVRDGFVDYSTCKFAVQEEFDALTAKSKPEKGDLLITKDGTIGRYSVFSDDFPICINQSVALVKPQKEKVVPEFLAAYIGSQGVQSRFQGMKKGNALPHLQITELAKFPVFSPTMDDQALLKSRLVEVEAKRDRFLSALKVADELFASLQHRAFHGEL